MLYFWDSIGQTLQIFPKLTGASKGKNSNQEW